MQVSQDEFFAGALSTGKRYLGQLQQATQVTFACRVATDILLSSGRWEQAGIMALTYLAVATRLCCNLSCLCN